MNEHCHPEVITILRDDPPPDTGQSGNSGDESGG